MSLQIAKSVHYIPVVQVVLTTVEQFSRIMLMSLCMYIVFISLSMV